MDTVVERVAGLTVEECKQIHREYHQMEEQEKILEDTLLYKITEEFKVALSESLGEEEASMMSGIVMGSLLSEVWRRFASPILEAETPVMEGD